MKDPLYNAILKGLEGPLDADAFEACAVQLLRPKYPTLTPMAGGNDAGMDGAMAGPNGVEMPLIATTEDDVIGNLTKSLKSYAANGRPGRVIALATSQALTPRRKRNLEKRANELGFGLASHDINDRGVLAPLLYGEPLWRMELLGLSGAPPALSLISARSRPADPAPLVGRDAEIRWLQERREDVLLVGQPGMGKTSLLQVLVDQGEARFAATRDLRELADALRALRPAAVIVDDAHAERPFLTQLRQLRGDIGQRFRIVASCWPGQREETAHALGVGAHQALTLERLSRKEILAVIERWGVTRPAVFVEELIAQAAGKPGLAVTLCDLARRVGSADVFSGQGLLREAQGVLRGLVGELAESALSAFAVGGAAGMRMADVARLLGLPIGQLQQLCTGLAAAGILEDTDYQTLAVLPPALGQVLMRERFFCRGKSLPIDDFLRAAPDPRQAARTLIAAAWRGAEAPLDLIMKVMEGTSHAPWDEVGWLGETACREALRRKPEELVAIAPAALRHIPREVLPLLLGAAERQPDLPSRSADAIPLRIIEDWAKSGCQGTAEGVSGRRFILEASMSGGAAQGPSLAALEAACIAFSPAYERSEPTPGTNGGMKIYFGCQPLGTLRGLTALWPSFIERFQGAPLRVWAPIFRIVEMWLFPGPHAGTPKGAAEHIRRQGRKMLRDAARVGADRPCVSHWAKGLACRLRLRLRVAVDPTFEALFPRLEVETWERDSGRANRAAKRLARDWAKEAPDAAVERLLRYEAEANAIGGCWPRQAPWICALMAEQVPDCIPWLNVLLAADAAPDLLEPFLRQASTTHTPGWEAIMERCLRHERTRAAAVGATLRLDAPPAPLLKAVRNALPGLKSTVESLCLRKELPERRVRELLTHDDGEVAFAAAVGEWASTPHGSVRAGLDAAWREAALRASAGAAHLPNLLASDPRLATEWFIRRVSSDAPPDPDLYRLEEVVARLDGAQRRKILSSFRSMSYRWRRLVEPLVGDDVDLYRLLLTLTEDETLRLGPLQGKPDGRWTQLASAALAAGLEPDEIAEQTIGFGWDWAGDESDMWQGWIRAFKDLRKSRDARLRQIAERVSEIAERRRLEALAKERREAVFGSSRES